MLTFSCIHKPTCYMIGFISPSANNQQSVNMNWRQTITNSTHSLQSANRDPYDTHSPQSPFGPVFEGRTHSEDLSSKRWASYDSSSPSVRPTAQRFDHIWRDCRVYLCENLWRDVCSPSFFFFSLYIPTGNITATTLAPAPSWVVSCCFLWLRQAVGPLSSY